MRNVGRRQDFMRVNVSEQDSASARYDTLTKVFILLALIFLLCTVSFFATFSILYTHKSNRLPAKLENILNKLRRNLMTKEKHNPTFDSFPEQTVVNRLIKDVLKGKYNLHDLVQAQRNPWVIVDDSNHKEHMLEWRTFKSFVHCERFRPDPRENYLDSTSMFALQACYRIGVNLTDIEEGVHRNEKPEMRYDLENLYITCEHVFNEHFGKFTRELFEDYKHCKDSRALNPTQVNEFEKSRNRRH